MSRTVRLDGLSGAVNPRDLRLHFAGLDIPQGGVTILGGERGLAFLCFATLDDARRALQLSGCPLKGSMVYVSPSSIIEMERSVLNFSSFSGRNGVHENRNLDRRDSRYYPDNQSFPTRHERNRQHSRSSERVLHSTFRDSRSPRWQSRSPQRYSRPRHEYNRSPQWHSRSPQIKSRSPHVKSRSPRRRVRSPRSPSNERDPIYDGDFHVHVTNLTYTASKEDLSKWFFNLVSNDQIKLLYDEKGHRTRECFVMFTNEKDYKRVLTLDKVTFCGRLLFISPISKSNMRNIITGRKTLLSHHSKGKCVYLRNFPIDVTKRDIQKFFAGFSLKEEDISLLCNKEGVGLGEVLVSFSSEEDLEGAEKLHRKKFKDKEIPLRRIPDEKLQSFLCANSVSLMPEDPNDCVTQEDDLHDEDIDQEEDELEENVQDDNIPDEDSGFHQTDNAHEFVTQADDESAARVVDAPSTVCISSESSIHVDNGEAIQEGAPSNDEELDELQ